MRRVMLANGPAVAGPIVAGTDATLSVASTTSFGAGCYWTDVAATASGTITSVKANFASATGSAAFFTISPAGVIRAIGSTFTPTGAVQTVVVSLTVVAGDFLGAWMTGVSCRTHSGLGGTYYAHNASGTKPTAGANRADDSGGTAERLLISTGI